MNSLIAKGASISARDQSGGTPLHGAAEAENPNIVRALIAARADVAAQDQRGRTPLLLATTRVKNVEVARQLLKAGADPSTADVNGRTPLHEAVQIHELAMVELLVEANAQINAEGKSTDGVSGATPLQLAIDVKDLPLETYLRSKGAKAPASFVVRRALRNAASNAAALFMAPMH